MSGAPAQIWPVAGARHRALAPARPIDPDEVALCDLYPVELNEHEAEAFAETLLLLAQRLRSL